MNRKSLLASAALIGLLLGGCKKDVFNEKRTVGTWTVDEYIVNGTDLLTDGYTRTISSTEVTTSFSSATLIFEEDGDFSQSITYSMESSYSSYLNTYGPIQSVSSGLWSDLKSDLLLSFESNSNSHSNNFNYYDLLGDFSSPMNSILISSDDQYYAGLTERYDIIKLTKDELEMTGTFNGQSVTIKASK